VAERICHLSTRYRAGSASSDTNTALSNMLHSHLLPGVCEERLWWHDLFHGHVLIIAAVSHGHIGILSASQALSNTADRL